MCRNLKLIWRVFRIVFLSCLLSVVAVAQDESQKPQDPEDKKVKDQPEAQLPEVNQQFDDENIPQQDVGPDEAGEQVAEANNQNLPSPNINTAVVNTATTSSSGSPGVLSGNDGNDRDGTNNTQRATLNIAGSPVPGVRKDDD